MSVMVRWAEFLMRKFLPGFSSAEVFLLGCVIHGQGFVFGPGLPIRSM